MGRRPPAPTGSRLTIDPLQEKEPSLELPTPQEPDPNDPRWSVIRYALDSNARTIRYCLIGLVTGGPITAVVVELIQHIR